MDSYAFLILINLSTFVLAKAYYQYCYTNGNYTLHDAYHTNLKNLLSSMPLNMRDNGFYNASLGDDTDRVYALAFCRGDVQLTTCRSCVQNGTVGLIDACLNRKQGLVYVGYTCNVRYSNWPLFGRQDTSPSRIFKNVATVASPDKFNGVLRQFLDDLLLEAASGGPLMKVGAGSRMAPNFVTIMALLQCSPDLSEQTCTNCLMTCTQWIPDCCQNARGVLIYQPSCNLRYEAYPFFNINRIHEVRRMLSMSPPAPVPQTAPVPTGNEANNKTQTTLLVAVSIISSIALLACIGIWLVKKTRKKMIEKTLADDRDVSIEESLLYDFNKIREATNNFSDFNKLGEGGFGAVYKGKLQNGQEIAVKRLFPNLGHGELEFRNEVTLLAKLNHKNLVKLFGFAQERKEKVLIFEFVRNASLDHAAMFDPTKPHAANWNIRAKIIRGIARGLLYLHENSRLRVIHRDLKPGNILLDEDMNPKIADFGLARLYEHDESEVNASRVAGTYGYMPPEYALNGQFSIKTDVFSFGVLILQIISGQKHTCVQHGDPSVEESLLNFVWRNWHHGKARGVIDPILKYDRCNLQEIIRCIHIALLCVQENASNRPTMASIGLMLGSFTITLPTPSRPAFLVSSLHHQTGTRHLQSCKTSDVNVHSRSVSKNDASFTELHPR